MDELMAWMEDKVKQQEAAAGAAGSKAPPQPRPPPTASAPTTEQTSASFDAAVNATSSILLPPSSWVLAALQRLKVSLLGILALLAVRMSPCEGVAYWVRQGTRSCHSRTPAYPSPPCRATAYLHQVLALESEREYLAAATDARVYRAESRWAWSRVQRLQVEP